METTSVKITEITLKRLRRVFSEGKKVNPMVYTQMKRNELFALYRVTMPEDNFHVGYEVFLIKNIKVNAFRNREVYPKENEFGSTAFSFHELEDAYKCFDKFDDFMKKKGG